MKITQETPRVHGSIQIRIDPHDGTCHGDHDVVLVALPFPPGIATDKTHYSTVTWRASAFLSVTGSREFGEAILKACEIADQIATDGEYRP